MWRVVVYGYLRCIYIYIKIGGGGCWVLGWPVAACGGGGLLFAWLSLVVSVVESFCAVLFPTRCLG